jgi:hypothetical protein
MASHSRSMLHFAVTATVAAMLWTAAPVMAAEPATPGDTVAVPAQTVAPAATPTAQSATPAQAAPAQAAVAPTAAPVQSTPTVVRREASRARVASSNYERRVAPVRVAPIRANLECSGYLCGRQFVLMMLGVGY